MHIRSIFVWPACGDFVDYAEGMTRDMQPSTAEGLRKQLMSRVRSGLVDLEEEKEEDDEDSMVLKKLEVLLRDGTFMT